MNLSRIFEKPMAKQSKVVCQNRKTQPDLQLTRSAKQYEKNYYNAYFQILLAILKSLWIIHSCIT